MLEPAHLEVATTTADPEPADDRSMRFMELAMAGIALVVALALALVR